MLVPPTCFVSRPRLPLRGMIKVSIWGHMDVPKKFPKAFPPIGTDPAPGANWRQLGQRGKPLLSRQSDGHHHVQLRDHECSRDQLVPQPIRRLPHGHTRWKELSLLQRRYPRHDLYPPEDLEAWRSRRQNHPYSAKILRPGHGFWRHSPIPRSTRLNSLTHYGRNSMLTGLRSPSKFARRAMRRGIRLVSIRSRVMRCMHRC